MVEQWIEKVLLPRHILMKFQNIKDEEMILKVVAEKYQFIDKRTHIRFALEIQDKEKIVCF